MAELNIQYPDFARSALAGQTIQSNQIRNALSLEQADQARQELGLRQEEFAMRKDEQSAKMNAAASERAASHWERLREMPDEQVQTLYPFISKELKQMFPGTWTQNLPDQYDPSLKPQFEQAYNAAVGKAGIANIGKEKWTSRGTNQFGQEILESTTGDKKAVGTPDKGVSVNVTNKGDEAGAIESAKYNVKHFEEIDKKAIAAEDTINAMEILGGIDVTTGALEPVKATASKYIEALGWDPASFGLQGATDVQKVNAILGQVVLKRAESMKGNLSDKDVKFLMQTVPSIAQTPEAYRFIIRATLAMEKRTLEHRNFLMEYQGKYDTLKGAESAWQRFISEHPVAMKSSKTGETVFVDEYMKKRGGEDTPDKLLADWREMYNLQRKESIEEAGRAGK